MSNPETGEHPYYHYITKQNEIIKKLKDKLIRIEATINLAENWCIDQEMSESQICMAVLKDIKKIVKE